MRIRHLTFCWVTALIQGCEKDTTSENNWWEDAQYGDECASGYADTASCYGDDDSSGEASHEHHEHEVITTVVLTFESGTSGEGIEVSWADPENDGSPSVDDILLSNGTVYDVSVQFLNESEIPGEDLTPKIVDEEDEHQLFFTGSGVSGPASDSSSALVQHAYADQDASALPIGLVNTFTTIATGTETLTVTLRHLPYEDGHATKTAGLASDVAEDGFSAIPGANDVQIDFDLTVE